MNYACGRNQHSFKHRDVPFWAVFFLLCALYLASATREDSFLSSVPEDCPTSLEPPMKNVGPLSFNIPQDYDFSRSSEENYKVLDAPFGGKYAKFRLELDYQHHSHYSLERQRFHDVLIDLFDQSLGGVQSQRGALQWLVFTAGVMGSGKSHTLRYLGSTGILPLQSFTLVDPDAIRSSLPEYNSYVLRDRDSAGERTQREVGYLSEVMVLNALENGGSVVLDGSLRDEHWFRLYIRNMRKRYSRLRIGILHISAPLETCIQRMYRRASTTGRVVPEHLIRQMYAQVNGSVESLRTLVDFFLRIDNSMDHRAPELMASSSSPDPRFDDLREVWSNAVLLSLNDSYFGVTAVRN